MKSINKQFLIVCFILLSCVLMFTSCLKQENDVFYCNDSADDWNYYNSLIQKTAKANAIYRAVKIHDNEGDSIQYEIRYKETNVPKMIIEYDKSGKILSYSENYSQNSVSWTKYTYEYNEAGLLEKIFGLDKKSNEKYLCSSFEYDSDNKCSRFFRYNTLHGTIYSETIYEWSDDKKTVYAQNYYYKSELDYQSANYDKEPDTKYEYDDSGRLIKKSSLSKTGDGTINLSITYHYNGSILQKAIYGSSTDISMMVPNQKWESLFSPECEYDSNERLSKLNIYQTTNIIPTVMFNITFEYDDRDNKIQESVIRDNMVLFSIAYEYDENDICTKSIVYDGESNIIKENVGYTGIIGKDSFYIRLYEYDFIISFWEANGDWSAEYGVIGNTITFIE